MEKNDEGDQMKPYKEFKDWMHIHASLRKMYSTEADWNQIIVCYLEWIFLFLIEWKFSTRMEDYKEE
jgi:hypothetical protein